MLYVQSYAHNFVIRFNRCPSGKQHIKPVPYRLHEPRIYFHEIQFHGVRARRQIERFSNVRSFALDVVTATKLHFAARSDFAAVPALKVLKVFKSID